MERRDTQPPHRGTDSVPVVVRISPAQVDQIITAQMAHQTQKESSSELWMIVLTGILAVGTLGLWKATRDLVKDSARFNKQHLRGRILRGDGPERPPSRVPQNKQWTYTFTVPLKNFGITVANVTSLGTRMAVVEGKVKEADLAVEIGEDTAGVLGPGESQRLSIIGGPFPPDVEMRFRSPSSDTRLYLRGIVNYTDIFDEPHLTEFMLMIEWDAALSFSFSPAGPGNRVT